MFIKILIYTTLFSFFIFDSVQTFSQSHGSNSAESWLNRPIGARAIGMGSAYTAAANEPTGIFYNPACLSGFSNTPQFSLMFSPLGFGRTHSALAYGQTLSEEFGVGVGVNHLYHGSFTARNVFGHNLGEFTNEQFSFMAAGSWKTGVFSAGAALKYLFNTLRGSGSNGTAFTADLGAKADIAELFTVGVTAQNLFGSMSWNNSTVGDKLPFTIRAGAAVEISLSSSSYTVRKNVRGETETIQLPPSSYLTLSIDAVQRQYEDNPAFLFGAEYVVIPEFSLRGGIPLYGNKRGVGALMPFTAWGGGFSIAPDIKDLPFSLQIDYAISSETMLESQTAHYFSLIIGF